MNKREKTAIISKIAINTWLIIWYIVLFNIFIFPSLSEIKTIKEEVLKIYQAYEKLSKNWIDFADFKANSDVQKNKKLANLLPNITSEFYKANYYNTSNETFEKFLEKKEEEVLKVRKTNIAEIRESLLSQVLPKYSEAYSVEWASTDLEFVNYIETFLNRFNIVTNASLWVNELIPLNPINDWVDNKNSKKQNFESDLFYIPMDLDLKWTKEDILKFIYYISNIDIINWDVNTKNDLHTIFYKDDFVQRDLTWIAYVKEENNTKTMPNKFIARMMDIQSIEIPEYFDKSWVVRDTKQKQVTDYINFLINDKKDADTEYEIKVSLHFYVRWVSQSVIKTDIQKIQTAFNTLKTNISGDIKKLQSDIKATKNVEKITKLKSLEKYLIDLDPTAKALWVKLENDNVNSQYIKAKDLEYHISRISALYNEIKK